MLKHLFLCVSFIISVVVFIKLIYVIKHLLSGIVKKVYLNSYNTFHLLYLSIYIETRESVLFTISILFSRTVNSDRHNYNVDYSMPCMIFRYYFFS